jgi:hypothetical protein
MIESFESMQSPVATTGDTGGLGSVDVTDHPRDVQSRITEQRGRFLASATEQLQAFPSSTPASEVAVETELAETSIACTCSRVANESGAGCIELQQNSTGRRDPASEAEGERASAKP